MPPFRNCRSLLAFATCLTPNFVLTSPLASPGTSADGLSRRGNPYHIPCGNAPNIIAGYPVATTDIVAPDPNGNPPQATTDPSGYFPYLWCGAGTSTYVFIDPIGNYGFNKGTNQPIFWTGLDGAHNATINAQNANAASNINPPTGDGSIDGPSESSLNFLIPVGDIAGNSGIAYIEVFAQDSNHQKLTWGIYSSALTIMKDFVLTYPLYADTMYFQIGDGHWSTVGNGYVGIVLQGTTQCYLKGSEAQNNGLPCGMPSNYPDN